MNSLSVRFPPISRINDTTYDRIDVILPGMTKRKMKNKVHKKMEHGQFPVSHSKYTDIHSSRKHCIRPIRPYDEASM